MTKKEKKEKYAVSETDEVCIFHLRWVVNGVCMGAHQRYDAVNHRCMYVENAEASDILRKFHSGVHTFDQAVDLLVNHRGPDDECRLVDYDGIVC